MQTLAFSKDGKFLLESLNEAPATKPSHRGETIHVDGVGGSIYFVYEQLRNAAEYSEQHLLLRRAIERFLQRSVNLNRLQPLGHELVIELTQSRYIKNDSITLTTVKQLDQTMQQFAQLYHETLRHERNREVVRKWILQTASVHLEQQLVEQQNTRAFTDFAYHHYLHAIEESSRPQDADQTHFEVALYCAVHRTIMKSDLATTRAYGLASQILPVEGMEAATYFTALNRLIDELFSERTTNRLIRLISQYGAPMRILREIVVTNPQVDALLNDKIRLLDRVRLATQDQYKQVRTRLNKGIVRSVAFIAITKVLIGVAVEIPYDLLRHGAVVWRPLVLNVLFPPIYMATLGLSIRQPSRKNIDLIEEAAERILYETDKPAIRYRLRRRVSSPALNSFFNILYAVTFVLWLALLGWVLSKLGFNAVSGVIFFVFLSTVSFFGFRLTQTAREYEMIEARRGAFAFIADFFYTPFIRIGHWISDTYASFNVVSRVLDIMIEMPLKTVLRFMQQWIGFLRDKQEEM
jgi:hypothetical protein